jgi:hypothetical protein
VINRLTSSNPMSSAVTDRPPISNSPTSSRSNLSYLVRGRSGHILGPSIGQRSGVRTPWSRSGGRR